MCYITSREHTRKESSTKLTIAILPDVTVSMGDGLRDTIFGIINLWTSSRHQNLFNWLELSVFYSVMEILIHTNHCSSVYTLWIFKSFLPVLKDECRIPSLPLQGESCCPVFLWQILLWAPSIQIRSEANMTKENM